MMLAAACTATGIDAPDLTLSRKVPTVVKAAWRGEAEGVTLVALDDEGTEVLRWPTELGDDGTWRAVTLGLRPATRYCFRMEVVIEGETDTTGCVEQSTGDLPDTLEPLVVEENTRNSGLFTTGTIASTARAAIYDAGGVPVWWWAMPDPAAIVTRVHRALDGRSLLINAAAGIGADPGADMHIYRVAYDGAVLETVPTVGAHHDFVELPDGSLAWLAYEERLLDGVVRLGDVIVERDPSGATRQVWSAFDWFDFRDFELEVNGSIVHANVLQYDAATDRYWVCLRNFGQYVAVDRATGALVEKLLGEGSDVQLAVGTQPSHPHGFRWIDEETLLGMDNRESSAEVSRLVKYEFDREDGVAAETWTFESDQGLHLLGLGDVAALPGGDVVALWSTAGQIQRLDADSNTVWRATSGIGTAFSYLEWWESPDTLPSP